MPVKAAATFDDDLQALRQAEPPWRADNLGVRGNPVEFHREQARVDWPNQALSRRGGTVETGTARPGAPEQPPSVPAQ